MRASVLAASLLALALPASAQQFTGTFTAQGQAGPITLTLQQAAGGAVTGTLSGNGAVFQVEAQPEEAATIVGTATGPQGRLFFEATLQGDQLHVIFVEPGPDGQPNYDTAQELAFARQGSAGAMGAMGLGGAGAMAQPPGGAMPPAQPGTMGGAQPGALDDGTPLGREWSQGLAGRKLTRLSSYSSNDIGGSGGYSSREELTLCSNGEYLYRSGSSVSVDVGGAAGGAGGGGGDMGRWRVVTQGQAAGLELRAQSGQVTLVRLDFQDNLVHIDGGKVYRTAAEVCQ
jgi:hypothetical protein